MYRVELKVLPFENEKQKQKTFLMYRVELKEVLKARLSNWLKK